MPRSSYSPLRAGAHVTLGIPLVVLACLLLLTACGGTSSTGGTSAPALTATSQPSATATMPTPAATTPAATGAATISMGTSSFSGTPTVTVKAGQAVSFTSSGTHDLVIGMHGQFAAQNGAPSELNTSSGMTFSPGDAKTIAFPTSGTFNITCTIHPSMQATVVVMP